MYVDAINEKSIKVSWQPPDQLANKVKNYVINVTQLHTFDPDALADLSHAELSISVDRGHNSVLVNNLKPFTMYEVSVMATNTFGSSLPSFRVRTLTLDSSISGRSGSVGAGGQLNAVVPKLPGKNAKVLSYLNIFSEIIPKKSSPTERPGDVPALNQMCDWWQQQQQQQSWLFVFFSRSSADTSYRTVFGVRSRVFIHFPLANMEYL